MISRIALCAVALVCGCGGEPEKRPAVPENAAARAPVSAAPANASPEKVLASLTVPVGCSVSGAGIVREVGPLLTGDGTAWASLSKRPARVRLELYDQGPFGISAEGDGALAVGFVARDAVRVYATKELSFGDVVFAAPHTPLAVTQVRGDVAVVTMPASFGLPDLSTEVPCFELGTQGGATISAGRHIDDADTSLVLREGTHEIASSSHGSARLTIDLARPAAVLVARKREHGRARIMLATPPPGPTVVGWVVASALQKNGPKGSAQFYGDFIPPDAVPPPDDAVVKPADRTGIRTVCLRDVPVAMRARGSERIVARVRSGYELLASAIPADGPIPIVSMPLVAAANDVQLFVPADDARSCIRK